MILVSGSGKLAKELEKLSTKSLPINILSRKEMDITNDEIEDIKVKDLEFDEDVFGFEEEPKKKTKNEEDFVRNIDKEIETSIVNITRK